MLPQAQGETFIESMPLLGPRERERKNKTKQSKMGREQPSVLKGENKELNKTQKASVCGDLYLKC